MADTTARVAGLVGEAAAAATAVAGVEAAAAAAAERVTALGAVAGNVSDLTALSRKTQVSIERTGFGLVGAKTNLVALGAGLAAGLAATAAAGGLGAFTRDVAGLAASVAGLGVLGSLGAVTACRFALGESPLIGLGTRGWMYLLM